MIKKLKERPELFVEMLFSKINSTLYFLEYGHEKPTITSQPREAAEFEVKPGIAADLPMSLGIVVSALLMDDKRDLVEWVEKSLQSAVNERKSWELEAEARGEEEDPANPKRPPSITVVPNNETCRLAMIKNGHFRLLLSLVGMDRITSDEEEDAPWIIPSSLGSANLDESLQAIQKYLQEPMNEVNGRDPREQLRRKKKDARDGPTYDPSYHIDFGDQSEGVDDIDDEILFPANPRSRSNKSAQNKPSRRKRRDAGIELSDEAAEQRRLKRQAAALERQRRIKSDLYIHASDEDSDSEADEEFFAREEARRKQQAANVKRAALFADEPSSNVRGKKTIRRRKRQVEPSEDEDEDMSDQESDGGVVQNTSKRQRAETHATPADDSDDEMLDAEPDLPAPGTE
ncbi:Topoisomerase 1-associated factor 1, partial [Ascosphaera atra]